MFAEYWNYFIKSSSEQNKYKFTDFIIFINNNTKQIIKVYI